VSASGLNSDLAGKAAGGRRLIAVVYADMVGYSRLISLDDADTLRRLRTLRRALIDPAIREYGGKVVQTGGDSLLVAFDSIDGAVRCAVKVQQQVPVYDGDQSSDRRIRFRVGIDMGDAIPEGTDLHGDAVNIAARLEAASPVGGICVSRSVRDHVHGRLGLAFEPIGELTLKNIARPVEGFVLRMDPATEAIESPVQAQTAGPPDVGLANAPRLSIVVLPFDNLGRDAVDDYIVDGITEDLTTDISRVADFLVIARNSAFTYKGKPIDIKRIGEELSVRYAVEGSVRRAGEALRINVQLLSTETGAHLWADRFDVGRDEVSFSIDDIVRQIGVALNVQLLNIESARGARERPGNPDASDIILSARALLIRGATPQLASQAASLFEQALKLEPNSVIALAGLAEALLDSCGRLWHDPAAPARIRRAEELLTQAELLRADDMRVMWVRVYLLGIQGRYAEATAAAQRAIEAYPNSPGPHYWLGLCLMFNGRATDAILEFKQAIRVNPRNPHNHNRYYGIGVASMFLDQYEEAVVWLYKSLGALPPGRARTRGDIFASIAAAQALAGESVEAHLSGAEAMRLWPTLTARSYFQLPILNPVAGAHLSRLREGLRLAGIRDHADEDADSNVALDGVLHTDYEAPTPTQVPGATTIRTPNLAALLEQHRPLLLDASPMSKSIPGTIGLMGGGIGGSLSDKYQDRLERKMQQLTRGDRTLRIVTVGWNAERYQGWNLALRLVALGYTNVYWYRGGREAWEVAGLPETEVVMQDW
jgi:TolB-like protein/class 3 adenylate cyclase/tetratricopeptide (TPR) repeat protein